MAERAIFDARTIIEAFNIQVAALGRRPALRSRRPDGTWSVRSWTDYGAEVRACTAGLSELGVGAGDVVATLSANRAEYVIADIAALALGATPVPVYHTNSPAQVRYVLDHAGARVVLCEDAEQLAKVHEVAAELPRLEATVSIDGTGRADRTYSAIVAEGRALDARHPELYDLSCAKIQPEDLACIIYTSGTTGPPKGAMISHANFISTAHSVVEAIDIESPRFLSYLPLAHSFERVVSHYGMIALGGETWYGGGIPTLREDLAACHPTIFTGVPRVFEKFEAAIRARLEEMPGVQGRLARHAVAVARRCVDADEDRAEIPRRDRVQRVLLDRLVLAKLRARAGFDELQMAVSGAAPITTETLRFFTALGLPICEGYGLTETCAATVLNVPGSVRTGTVGRPLPGVQVAIAEDGEILIKGGGVFEGYLDDEARTAAAMDGDWFRSGDLGSLDADGYVTITGRKKDLIITAGGKNISPQNIESALKAEEAISQAIVIGDRRPYLTALIALDEEALAPWAEAHGLPTDAGQLSQTPQAAERVQEAVDRVNESLSQVETIKKFTILPRDLSQDLDELTPTLKVRRHRVDETFADEIEAMYA